MLQELVHSAVRCAPVDVSFARREIFDTRSVRPDFSIRQDAVCALNTPKCERELQSVEFTFLSAWWNS